MQTIVKIIERLNKLYRVRPWREKPFKVLIACILSQRTRDEVTREATRRLFRVADSPEKILMLSERQIEKLIYPVGFYRQKAKNIKRLCKILVKVYGGKVPSSQEELIKLPGVGLKTSDVVASQSFSQPVIACDAHVVWVSNQLGWTNSKKPEKVREDLHRIIPEKYRRVLNLLLVEFGKDVCNTGRPKCSICPIEVYCPNSRLRQSFQSGHH